jgi:protein-disulfide isomerase
MAKLSRRQTYFAVAAVGALAICAAVYAFVGYSDTEAKPSAKNYSVFKDDRTMGSPNAPIVMIEYAAPTCPHCAHFYVEVLPKLKKDYIDTGKVLYVFRVFPLFPVDGAVELVARSLPPEKYFSYLDLIYRNQPKWDPEYGVTDMRGALVALSAKMGVSAETFDRVITDKDALDRINRIAQDGQMRYAISVVPTFVINGTVIKGQDAVWDVLKSKLDSLSAPRE